MNEFLPRGWELATLSGLISAKGVFVDGDWVESKDQDPQGDVRLTQLADVGDGRWKNRSSRYMTSNKARDLRCTFLQKGDVLVARMPDPLGRSCVFPGDPHPCVTVVDVSIVRPGLSGISTAWLSNFINAAVTRASIHALQAGSTRKRISRKNLAGIQIPVPPTAEQHRIVEAIESYFTRLDDAVATLERVQRNLKRYRASVLKAAVEGRLVPSEAELARAEGRNYEPGSVLLERVAVTKNAQKLEGDDLAPLPEGWAWTTLGQVAEIKGGITKGQKRRQGVVYKEVPYLRVANVQRGFLDLSEMKTIAASEQEIAELRLAAGDVLFNEGGDRDKLGRGWIWNNEIDECIHQNHVFRARLVEAGIHPKFLSWYANTEGRRYFFAEGKHTTNLASINMTKLRGLPLPVPPRNEQLRIVAAVEESLSLIDDSIRSVERELSRCHRLRQSILKWAFEGRLADQDPSDEPASVLLERIKAERAAPAGPRTRRERKPRASKDVE